MEKIKGVFSKIGSAVKSHLKVVIAVIVVIIVAILALNLVGGSEKRAVKKYMSALNSYKKDKIVKAMDIEGAIAWSETFYADEDELVERFEDALEDVKDDEKDAKEDSIKEATKSLKKSNVKYKLKKIIYSTTAKDNKDLKKVVFKYKVTSKASDDAKEDAKDSDLWNKEKAFNKSSTGYGTMYLYKNKVIYASL